MALLAGAGAAGCSIEDYDPATGRIDDVGLAGERVAIAAEAAHGLPEPMVLTGRAENHIVAVVKAVGAPLNVLALPHGPTLAELGSVGARRVSTGSLLAAAAYRTLMAGAHELMTDGTSRYGEGGLSRGVLREPSPANTHESRRESDDRRPLQGAVPARADRAAEGCVS